MGNSGFAASGGTMSESSWHNMRKDKN
jgi:hypothetical protein